jgi:hypothetical protein
LGGKRRARPVRRAANELLTISQGFATLAAVRQIILVNLK